MAEPLPSIRVHSKSGALLIRESLCIQFYMHRPHAEVAPFVLRALERYLREVPAGALSSYAEEAGDWEPIDDEGWSTTLRDELLKPRGAVLDLRDASGEKRYRFEYLGRRASVQAPSDSVCAVGFWLPTEYLAEHGAEALRELVLELAREFPFNSGHAGLAFNCELDLVGVEAEVWKWCRRYPEMDLPRMSRRASQLGTKVSTVSWMTLLGEPVLGAVGLREQLRSTGGTLLELDNERVAVVLAPRPEAREAEHGGVRPSYRKLATALEPWLFHERQPAGAIPSSEELRRWERRFID